MRLIDGDALRDEFDPDDKTDFDATGIRHYIASAPTIDAVPVVHGRWRYDGEKGEYRCTNCEEWGAEDDERTKYCPSCGAKMDKEEPT